MPKYIHRAGSTTVKMDMPDFKQATKDLGIDEHGAVQAFATKRAAMRMDKYVPFRTGVLKNTADYTSNPTQIEYNQEYARVMYFGKVMVDPITKAAGFLTDDGWKSRRGVKKEVSDREFNYNGAPQRGAFWDEKMVANEGDQWVKEVQEFSDRLKSK